MESRRQKQTPELERHYSTTAAARILGYTSGHMRNMRVEGTGPRWVRAASGVARYPESALREYLSGVAA